MSGAASAALWREVRDVRPLCGAEGDLWRCSVRPSDGVRVAEVLDGALGGAPMVMDWGGGLVWAVVPAGTDLRARLAGVPGHATRLRAAADGIARVPAEPPEPAAVAALTRGLRARFDPRGLFAPAAEVAA